MTVQHNRKIFFWLFGLIFAIVLYFILSKYSDNDSYIVLSISLIIILLFFIIGEILSSFSGFCVYCLKSKSSSEILNFAHKEYTKEKKTEVIKKLKCALNAVVSRKYSLESINKLTKHIGIDNEETIKLINLTKRLITIKWVYWILGLCFSILNVFLIFSVDYFYFLRQPLYVSIGANIIIFLLFYAEGILITRIPEEVYLRILNLQEEKFKEIEKQKEIKITEQKEFEKKQENAIENIKVSIGYLLKINAPKDMLVKILREQGFSTDVSKKIISDLEFNLKAKKNIPVKRNGATEKLFLNKMYSDFEQLKSISLELNEIKESVGKIYEKQKEFETNLSKLNDVGNKFNLNNNDFNNSELLTSSKTNKSSFVRASKEKGYKFSEDVNFLYNLIKPQASKYKKEDVQSFLLYQNYSIEVVDDLMEQFKQNNVKFKEDKEENKIISFINNTFSRK